MGHFHLDLVHMGDLPLVHPVLHLSILDAGILIMVSKFDDVILEQGGSSISVNRRSRRVADFLFSGWLLQPRD